MKSIIITGKQGLGKTELANLIAKDKETVNIFSIEDIRYITSETKCLIFDGIDSEGDWSLFKSLSTKNNVTFRPRYFLKEITVDCSKMLLIGITNLPIDNKDARHSFIYNLY